MWPYAPDPAEHLRAAPAGTPAVDSCTRPPKRFWRQLQQQFQQAQPSRALAGTPVVDCCTRPCSASGGSSSRHRPATPASRPRAPAGLMRSPKRSAASRVTVSGWESMITLPRPAEVRCSPSARQPCTACHTTQCLGRETRQMRRL